MNAVAAERLPADEVEIESPVLGRVLVPVEQTFSFPLGVLGFPDCHDFALIPAEREGFFWLQSLDAAALVFVVVDPFRFVPDYSLELGPNELGPILPDDADDLLVLCIVTLPSSADDPATVNLRGPLALNLRRRVARQVVLDGPWNLRHELDLG